MDSTRRALFRAAAAVLVDAWAGAEPLAFASTRGVNSGRKVIVVACGRMRRE